MKITLIRHAKPEATYEGLLTWREFSNWLDLYELASLQKIPNPLYIPKNCKIFTSTLSRAIETACGLFPSVVCESDALFDSVPVPCIPIPFIKWPVEWWIRLNRTLYTFGWPAKEEWIRKTRKRAQQAANFLSQQACETGEIILVGHGCMNALIGHSLKIQGWQGEAPYKVDYLGKLIFQSTAGEKRINE